MEPQSTAELSKKIVQLEETINKLKERLHRPKDPEKQHKYYEKNKDKILESVAEYKSKLDPQILAEKRKIYNHNSYIKRKTKKEAEPQ